jgi:hypothetical protein
MQMDVDTRKKDIASMLCNCGSGCFCVDIIKLPTIASVDLCLPMLGGFTPPIWAFTTVLA